MYALLSALFAAFTAIFAKVGVTNINANLATGIRTIVILIMIWLIVFSRGETKGIHHLAYGYRRGVDRSRDIITGGEIK